MTTRAAAAIAVSAALGGLAVGYLLGRRKKPLIKWADKYCERILFLPRTYRQRSPPSLRSSIGTMEANETRRH